MSAFSFIFVLFPGYHDKSHKREGPHPSHCSHYVPATILVNFHLLHSAPHIFGEYGEYVAKGKNTNSFLFDSLNALSSISHAFWWRINPRYELG